MTTLLRSKPVIENYRQNLIERIKNLKTKGITPNLKVFLVGEHPASVIYTKNKKKFCEDIGALCEIIRLQKDINPEDFHEEVKRIVDNPAVHGCLIQLPLPSQLKQIDESLLVPFAKDVDGFHQENVMQIYKGINESEILAPCTPKGIMYLFKHYNISLQGKKVVVIGRSLIVGKPMALMLTNANATVTHCHSKTKYLENETKQADIIISAVGQANFVTKKHIGENSPIVIDVGMNKNPKTGKLCGDCDFEAIKHKCHAITPVPGGVGPLTILMLAENLILAAERSLK